MECVNKVTAPLILENIIVKQHAFKGLQAFCDKDGAQQSGKCTQCPGLQGPICAKLLLNFVQLCLLLNISTN